MRADTSQQRSKKNGRATQGFKNKDKCFIFNKEKKGVLLERLELKGMCVSDG